MNTKTIGVAGAGLMGLGITQAMAMGGHPVLVYDVSETALRSATETIQRNLVGASRLGVLQESDISDVASRIRTTSSLSEFAGDADLVVEAVPENLDLKRRFFTELEHIAGDDTIITSNTSSLLPDDIAGVLDRPERFLVTHFFNPPYLIPLVEVVPGQRTDPEVVGEAVSLIEKIGNTPVVLNKAVPGFLINRLQIALLREALSLVQNGVASVDDVDKAVRSSIGRRLSIAGVFEVCDLAGLDVVKAAAETVLGDLNCTQELSELIRGHVDRGELGAKTGRGFYQWDEESIQMKRSRIAAALAAIRSFHRQA